MHSTGLRLYADCAEIHITDCLPKLRSFCENDAPKSYDCRIREFDDVPDAIQDDCVTAANTGMLARTPLSAWKRFLNGSLLELAQVPTDVDLIQSPEGRYQAARESLRMCYAQLTTQKGITDMAATKVLYLKRPNLVAISDSYVRDALMIRDPDSKRFPKRGDWHAARGVAVADAVRFVGQNNQDLIRDLQESLLADNGAWRLSYCRIIDALIWIDMAIPVSNAWRTRALNNGWDSVMPKVLCRKYSLPGRCCRGWDYCR